MVTRKDLMALSIADLIALNKEVVDVVRDKQREKAYTARSTFGIGDWVQFDARGDHYKGRIESFGPKNTKIRVFKKDSSGDWNRTAQIWLIPGGNYQAFDPNPKSTTAPLIQTAPPTAQIRGALAGSF